MSNILTNMSDSSLPFYTPVPIRSPDAPPDPPVSINYVGLPPSPVVTSTPQSQRRKPNMVVIRSVQSPFTNINSTVNTSVLNSSQTKSYNGVPIRAPLITKRVPSLTGTPSLINTPIVNRPVTNISDGLPQTVITSQPQYTLGSVPFPNITSTTVTGSVSPKSNSTDISGRRQSYQRRKTKYRKNKNMTKKQKYESCVKRVKSKQSEGCKKLGYPVGGYDSKGNKCYNPWAVCKSTVYGKKKRN